MQNTPMDIQQQTGEMKNATLAKRAIVFALSFLIFPKIILVFGEPRKKGRRLPIPDLEVTYKLANEEVLFLLPFSSLFNDFSTSSVLC